MFVSKTPIHRLSYTFEFHPNGTSALITPVSNLNVLILSGYWRVVWLAVCLGVKDRMHWPLSHPHTPPPSTPAAAAAGSHNNLDISQQGSFFRAVFRCLIHTVSLQQRFIHSKRLIRSPQSMYDCSTDAMGSGELRLFYSWIQMLFVFLFIFKCVHQTLILIRGARCLNKRCFHSGNSGASVCWCRHFFNNTSSPPPMVEYTSCSSQSSRSSPETSVKQLISYPLPLHMLIYCMSILLYCLLCYFLLLYGNEAGIPSRQPSSSLTLMQSIGEGKHHCYPIHIKLTEPPPPPHINS